MRAPKVPAPDPELDDFDEDEDLPDDDEEEGYDEETPVFEPDEAGR